MHTNLLTSLHTTMASAAAARPMASFSIAIGVKQFAKRGFASSSKSQRLRDHSLRTTTPQRCAAQIPKRDFRQTFRRSYAEQKVVSETTKRRSWGFFRWTWRVMYISAIAGLGYTGYGIYQGKHPVEQRDPDPNKKTLVVLGACENLLYQIGSQLMKGRYWLGFRLSTQESRHGRLQCHRHFASQLLPLHTPTTLLHHRHDRTSQHNGTVSTLPRAEPTRTLRHVLRLT